jgi:hypothetical protein
MALPDVLCGEEGLTRHVAHLEDDAEFAASQLLFSLVARLVRLAALQLHPLHPLTHFCFFFGRKCAPPFNFLKQGISVNSYTYGEK